MRIVRFFDKLEDRIRAWCSHRPILYAFIGGIGVVLFWRGVWHTVDVVTVMLSSTVPISSMIGSGTVLWWDGPLSFCIGSVLLLLTGVFVSNFIGNEIIISGLKGEKKVSDKTEREVRDEAVKIQAIERELHELSQRTVAIEQSHGPKADRSRVKPDDIADR